MEKIKKKYKGWFNFRTKVRFEYCSAYSIGQAKVLMMRSIAKKDGVQYSYVFNEFNEKNDNHKVGEING